MEISRTSNRVLRMRDLTHKVGFRPSTSIEVGVERFARWYQASYA